MYLYTYFHASDVYMNDVAGVTPNVYMNDVAGVVSAGGVAGHGRGAVPGGLLHPGMSPSLLTYMYVAVCVYIHASIYISAYYCILHIHAYANMHMHIQTCLHIYLHVYTFTYPEAHFIQASRLLFSYAYIWYTYIYTHIYI